MDTPNVPAAHAGGKPDLFSKVGPLPAWAWGAIVVAAYLVYRRVHASRAPVALTDPGNLVASAADGYASADTGSGGAGGGGGGGGGMTSADPGSSGYNYGDVLSGNYTGTTSGAVFNTNQQWGVYALNNMPKLGYAAGEVASAITFYLAGMPLTAAQRAIVQQALTSYGSPPLPLPLTDVVATPVAPADPPVIPAPIESAPVSVAPAADPVAPAPVVVPTAPPAATWIPAPIRNIIFPPYPVATYQPSNPTVYDDPAQPVSVDTSSVQQAIQQVGGGVAPVARTNVGGTRATTSFDAYSRSQLSSGGTVVAGDGRVFKLVNGVPTSIGMQSEVV